jgi:hypothetical protein
MVASKLLIDVSVGVEWLACRHGNFHLGSRLCGLPDVGR